METATATLHMLTESAAHSRKQLLVKLQDRDGDCKEEESVKNGEEETARNISPTDSSLPSTAPPPPLRPFLTGVNRVSIGTSSDTSLGKLYCGPCTTTADHSDLISYRTYFSDAATDETSSAVTSPFPPPSMLLSGPPGTNINVTHDGGNSLNFVYCRFISPDSNTDPPLVNNDRSGRGTIATSTTTTESRTTTASSISSNESSGSSNLSESDNFVETSSISPNMMMPLPKNPLVESNEHLSVVKSKFFVSGICCTTEVPIIKRILRPVKGVSRVQIQLIAKSVIVHHSPEIVTTAELAQTLEDQGFPTKMIHDGSNIPGADTGAATTSLDRDMKRRERSKFVISTLSLDHDWSRQNVQHLVKALRDEYKCSHKVRAIHPNPVSKTVKVEHDPMEAPIAEIAASLKAKCGVLVNVAVDGASCNLYVPKNGEEATATTGSVRVASPLLMDEDTKFLSFNVLRCNVVMSGLFWILSLPSHFEVL